MEPREHHVYKDRPTEQYRVQQALALHLKVADVGGFARRRVILAERAESDGFDRFAELTRRGVLRIVHDRDFFSRKRQFGRNDAGKTRQRPLDRDGAGRAVHPRDDKSCSADRRRRARIPCDVDQPVRVNQRGIVGDRKASSLDRSVAHARQVSKGLLDLAGRPVERFPHRHRQAFRCHEPIINLPLKGKVKV